MNSPVERTLRRSPPPSPSTASSKQAPPPPGAVESTKLLIRQAPATAQLIVRIALLLAKAASKFDYLGLGVFDKHRATACYHFLFRKQNVLPAPREGGISTSRDLTLRSSLVLLSASDQCSNIRRTPRNSKLMWLRYTEFRRTCVPKSIHSARHGSSKQQMAPTSMVAQAVSPRNLGLNQTESGRGGLAPLRAVHFPLSDITKHLVQCRDHSQHNMT